MTILLVYYALPVVLSSRYILLAKRSILINLKWNYIKRTLEILMRGYIKRQLLRYRHVVAPRLQHCPYSPEPRKYGSEAQAPLPPDTMQKLNKDEIKQIQKIVRSILYYTRAVDMMVLMALSTIASGQTKGTE